VRYYLLSDYILIFFRHSWKNIRLGEKAGPLETLLSAEAPFI